MSGVIVRLKKNSRVVYLEWTKVGQGPGMGMTLGAFRAYYQEEYGRYGMERLPERLARADATGTSSHVDTVEDLMKYNYADEFGQREISFEELWERYVEGEVCARCHYATRRSEMDGDVCSREKCRTGQYDRKQGNA